MVADKLNWARGSFGGGYLFALMGVGSVFGYALSHVMEEENYKFHFQYKGDGRLFLTLKSQFGCQNLANVLWTVPSLIGGGLYLQKCLGGLNSLKFFFGALGATGMFMSAFGEHSPFNFNLRRYSPVRFDSIEDGKGQMGADVLAGSVLYMIAFYHRFWFGAACFFAFDLCYYGP